MQDALNCVCEFHAKMNAPISPCPTLLACDRTAAVALAERVSALATEAMAVAPEGDVLLRRASMALRSGGKGIIRQPLASNSRRRCSTLHSCTQVTNTCMARSTSSMPG